MNIYLIIILLILIHLNFNEKFELTRELNLDNIINNCENNENCPHSYECINKHCVYINICKNKEDCPENYNCINQKCE